MTPVPNVGLGDGVQIDGTVYHSCSKKDPLLLSSLLSHGCAFEVLVVAVVVAVVVGALAPPPPPSPLPLMVPFPCVL